MRIYVNSHDGHKIRLRFPTRLLFNRATASLVLRHLPDEVGESLEGISREHLYELIKCVIKSKDLLNGEDLINIVSADGDRVRISL